MESDGEASGLTTTAEIFKNFCSQEQSKKRPLNSPVESPFKIPNTGPLPNVVNNPIEVISASESVSWQKPRRVARLSITKPLTKEVPTQNRFENLPTEHHEVLQVSKASAKPPPIFIDNVSNINDMNKDILTVLEESDYITKLYADNNLKVVCNTIEKQVKLNNYLKSKNVSHHTYQSKENRAYRVVLKNLHHTTEIPKIKSNLEAKGYKVRNIINGRRWKSKEPLNLFFVDLEPTKQLEEIFKLELLCNTVITVELPKRTKGLIQCTRCQNFGHTKSYCFKPHACVKCGDQHNSTSCSKPRDIPATCFLCNGPHPANYKGCDVYKKLLKQQQQNIASHRSSAANDAPQNIRKVPKPIPPKTLPVHNTSPLNMNNPNQLNYANVLNNNHTHLESMLSNLMSEFKSMFQQILEHNNKITNLLITLINKIQ